MSPNPNLSMLLTAWQGSGVLAGLNAVGFIRLDVFAVAPAVIATLVAATALHFWLAGRVDFPGLGGGFWLLLGLPYAIDFPAQLAPLLDLPRTGAISPVEAIAVVAAIIVAMVLTVFANLLLSRNGRASDVERTSFLLWPPLLAGILAQWAFYFIPAEMPGWPFLAVSYFQVAILALTAVFIPIIAMLYMRCLRLARPSRTRVWSTPVVLVVVAIQLLLCVAAPLALSFRGLPIQPIGVDLVIAVTVFFALAQTSDFAHSRSTRRT